MVPLGDLPLECASRSYLMSMGRLCDHCRHPPFRVSTVPEGKQDGIASVHEGACGGPGRDVGLDDDVPLHPG